MNNVKNGSIQKTPPDKSMNNWLKTKQLIFLFLLPGLCAEDRRAGRGRISARRSPGGHQGAAPVPDSGEKIPHRVGEGRS